MKKKTTKTQKRRPTVKKAPGAPKRFKSSYIHFFMHVHDSVKKSLPGKEATAPNISKKASEIWNNLPALDRKYWDDIAMREKELYLEQKGLYKGPWKVQTKRAKKDPSAPKRNPSAFLLFASTRRPELQSKHCHLDNTVISRLLGDEWRSMPKDKKDHYYLQRELAERALYKEQMVEWKRQKEIETTNHERDECGLPILWSSSTEVNSDTFQEKEEETESVEEKGHDTTNVHNVEEILVKQIAESEAPQHHYGDDLMVATPESAKPILHVVHPNSKTGQSTCSANVKGGATMWWDPKEIVDPSQKIQMPSEKQTRPFLDLLMNSRQQNQHHPIENDFNSFKSISSSPYSADLKASPRTYGETLSVSNTNTRENNNINTSRLHSFHDLKAQAQEIKHNAFHFHPLQQQCDYSYSPVSNKRSSSSQDMHPNHLHVARSKEDFSTLHPLQSCGFHSNTSTSSTFTSSTLPSSLHKYYDPEGSFRRMDETLTLWQKMFNDDLDCCHGDPRRPHETYHPSQQPSSLFQGMKKSPTTSRLDITSSDDESQPFQYESDGYEYITGKHDLCRDLQHHEIVRPMHSSRNDSLTESRGHDHSSSLQSSDTFLFHSISSLKRADSYFEELFSKLEEDLGLNDEK